MTKQKRKLKRDYNWSLMWIMLREAALAYGSSHLHPRGSIEGVADDLAVAAFGYSDAVGKHRSKGWKKRLEKLLREE